MLKRYGFPNAYDRPEGGYLKLGIYNFNKAIGWGKRSIYMRNVSVWSGNDGYQAIMGGAPMPPHNYLAFADFSQGADHVIRSMGLTEDDGLETAVILSLFTDRRAQDDDALPDSSDDRRGWWADAFSDVPADRIGSRLWLLYREKQTLAVVHRARDYAQEALAWLVQDGVAQSVDVRAEIVRRGVLGLYIEIARPDKTVAKYRFEDFWRGAL